MFLRLLLWFGRLVLLLLRWRWLVWWGVRFTDFCLSELWWCRLLWLWIRQLLPVTGLNLQSWCVLAAEVLLPDFPEGCAELLNAESVDNWVDSGVAMGEQDSNIEEDYGRLALRAEECDAVDDVEREPAASKEKKDQGQRLSKIQLLVIVLVGVCVTAGDLLVVKLLVDHVEDLCIDKQHEKQGREHPAEKVEIHHVVHADDVFKLAGDDEVGADGAILLETPQVVPA